MAYPIPEKVLYADDPELCDRQLFGDRMRPQHPTRGWCARCGIPWHVGNSDEFKGHTTKYCLAEVGGVCKAALTVFDENGKAVPGTDGHIDIELHGGCFPMCQWCWERTSIEERIKYHERLIDHWESNPRADNDDKDLRRAAIIYAIRQGR